MSSIETFARECDITARNLRRVPRDLRRALSTEVKAQVAVPLAAKVGAAATGPWAKVLQPGTKARAGADPVIVVGGMRPRLSGGAGPRDVVFGVEFGGGKRTTAVPTRPGRGGYKRRSTNQFASHKAPFVYPTIAKNDLEKAQQHIAEALAHFEPLDKPAEQSA